MEKISSFYESGRRYKSLQIIGPVFTGIGVLLLAIGALLFVFGVYSFLSGSTVRPPAEITPFTSHPVTTLSPIAGLAGVVSLVWSLGFVLSGLQFLVLGALLRVVIHLEENTRASAQALDKIRLSFEAREGTEPLFRS